MELIKEYRVKGTINGIARKIKDEQFGEFTLYTYLEDDGQFYMQVSFKDREICQKFADYWRIRDTQIEQVASGNWNVCYGYPWGFEECLINDEEINAWSFE